MFILLGQETFKNTVLHPRSMVGQGLAYLPANQVVTDVVDDHPNRLIAAPLPNKWGRSKIKKLSTLTPTYSVLKACPLWKSIGKDSFCRDRLYVPSLLPDPAIPSQKDIFYID